MSAYIRLTGINKEKNIFDGSWLLLEDVDCQFMMRSIPSDARLFGKIIVKLSPSGYENFVQEGFDPSSIFPKIELKTIDPSYPDVVFECLQCINARAIDLEKTDDGVSLHIAYTRLECQLFHPKNVSTDSDQNASLKRTFNVSMPNWLMPGGGAFAAA